MRGGIAGILQTTDKLAGRRIPSEIGVPFRPRTLATMAPKSSAGQKSRGVPVARPHRSPCACAKNRCTGYNLTRQSRSPILQQQALFSSVWHWNLHQFHQSLAIKFMRKPTMAYR
ncbi:MAG: hypothetical protein BJ554DRAFT_5106 [Olpidium bornovanus]|uniref:Uncharacterized protein n=1 Tax=Olpidium bornovanus TaxID=278681 RepID=A0A8H8A1Z6_9FUNG|nr:MAG: hypothetical protein BJ554DRAFT_5106 [Olpidium bornovanus]